LHCFLKEVIHLSAFLERIMKNYTSAVDSSKSKGLKKNVISEIHEIPDSKQAKIFLKFLNFIKENHPKISIQDNEEIRSNLKFTIPPLTNLEEFKKLYENSLLSKKEF